MSAIHPFSPKTTDVKLVAVEEKSSNHKSQLESSSGDNEWLCKDSKESIHRIVVEIFQSGPQWWADRPTRPFTEKKEVKQHLY